MRSDFIDLACRPISEISLIHFWRSTDSNFDVWSSDYFWLDHTHFLFRPISSTWLHLNWRFHRKHLEIVIFKRIDFDLILMKEIVHFPLGLRFDSPVRAVDLCSLCNWNQVFGMRIAQFVLWPPASDEPWKTKTMNNEMISMWSIGACNCDFIKFRFYFVLYFLHRTE